MSVKTEEETAVKPEGDKAPEAHEESAPSKKEGGSGGEVDASDNGQEDEGRSGRGDSKVATITELRRDRRTLRDRNAALEKQVQDLMAQVTTKQPPEKPSSNGDSKETPGFFEDPDSHLDRREKKLRESLISELVMASEKSEALNYIRSKASLTKEDEDAFADLMEENGLDTLAEKKPLQAARLAVDLWLREKGVAGKPPAQKSQAGSVRGGAAVGGEKKISRSYLRELQRRISKGEKGDKLEADLSDAWRAAREGRIIED